jgi:hypothetical protein
MSSPAGISFCHFHYIFSPILMRHHHKNNFTKENLLNAWQNSRQGAFTKIRARIQLSLGAWTCCWILHSNSKFKTQIEFAVKEQGWLMRLSPLQHLCPRGGHTERGTFLPTVSYVVTLWLGYFTPWPWFPSGWSIVALLWMAQCFLFHGLDRWHSSPIANIQHPVNMINRFVLTDRHLQ